MSRRTALGLHRLAATVAASLLIAGTASFPALAQQELGVPFAPGASSATITGSVQGPQQVDHIIHAHRGQVLQVSLSVTGPGAAYFDIVPAGRNHSGPDTGFFETAERAEFPVPSDGPWAIRVYLLGNDRNLGNSVDYALTVDLSQPDSGAQGARIVGVTGLTLDGALNVRVAPGEDREVVGALGNGALVRLLGCQWRDDAQWCRVEMMTDHHEQGWVDARFLAL